MLPARSPAPAAPDPEVDVYASRSIPPSIARECGESSRSISILANVGVFGLP
jgi:hypothetical protein